MKISNLIIGQSMRNIMDVVSFAVNSNEEDALLIYNALQEINEPMEMFDYITFLDRLTEMLFVHNKEDLAAKLLMISFQNGFDISSVMKKYFESDVTDESSIISMLDDYSKNSFKERKFSKLLIEVESTILLDDPQEYANININHIKAAAYFGSEKIFHKIVELNLIPLDRVERRNILWYSLLGRNDEIINYCSKHFNDNRYNILIEYIRIEILHQYELTADVINRTNFMLIDLVNTLYFKFFLFYYKMNEDRVDFFDILLDEIPFSLHYLIIFLSLISTKSLNPNIGLRFLKATRNIDDIRFDVILDENPSIDNFPSMKIITNKLDELEIYRIYDDMMHLDVNVNIKGSDSLTPLMIACRENFTERAQMLLEKGADPNIKNANGSTAIFYAIINANIVVIKSLLEHGADVSIQNSKGLTPIICAKRTNSQKIISLIENAPPVPKPKITKSDKDDELYALGEIVCAIKQNDYKLTKAGLQYANSMGYDLANPLIISMAIGQLHNNPNNKLCLKIIDLIVEYALLKTYVLIDMSIVLYLSDAIGSIIEEFNIDINMKFHPSIAIFDFKGHHFLRHDALPIYEYYEEYGEMDLTFLMIAVIYQNFQAVKELLRLNANPNLTCNGVHPLKICRYESIRSLLIEYGAKL